MVRVTAVSGLLKYVNPKAKICLIFRPKIYTFLTTPITYRPKVITYQSCKNNRDFGPNFIAGYEVITATYQLVKTSAALSP